MAREKKNGGCIGCLGGVFMIFVVLFIIVDTFTDSDDNDNNNNQEVEQQVEVADETEEVEVDEETAEEVEEVEEEVVEETREDRTLAMFDHQVIDGVDTYTYVRDVLWSADMLMTHFNSDGADLLKIIHDDLTNGVVFRLATTMVDGYGNETRQIVANMWYSQGTVERINYDNWPQLIRSGLYDTADGVIIHPGLISDIEENQKPNDYLPQFVRDTLYEAY